MGKHSKLLLILFIIVGVGILGEIIYLALHNQGTATNTNPYIFTTGEYTGSKNEMISTGYYTVFTKPVNKQVLVFLGKVTNVYKGKGNDNAIYADVVVNKKGETSQLVLLDGSDPSVPFQMILQDTSSITPYLGMIQNDPTLAKLTPQMKSYTIGASDIVPTLHKYLGDNMLFYVLTSQLDHQLKYQSAVLINRYAYCNYLLLNSFQKSSSPPTTCHPIVTNALLSKQNLTL